MTVSVQWQRKKLHYAQKSSLTLWPGLTRDIVKERFFKMFHPSGKPNKANRFWPRLLCAALNKLRLGRRKGQYPNPDALSLSNLANEDAKDDSQHLLADAVSRELKDIIFSAMRRLKPRYRAVLTLRCFRNMQYEHIAQSLQCSEFAAKIQFYRAKRALQKQLSRHGFGRGAFLAAMVLFGKITAPSEAAAKGLAISAAATKVGAAAGLAAVVTSKAAILSITAAGAISIGAVAVTSEPKQPDDALLGGGPTVSSQITGAITAPGKGAREYWHYYPHGTNGPVMMRLLKWDPRAKQSYCQWLQNERANYFFDRHKNTIFMRNHRTWRDDGSVWQLPTDNPALRKSLAGAQSSAQPMQYVRGDGAGLLVVLKQDEDALHSRITRNFNVLDEQYFLYDWPRRAGIIDARDTMHKRGWTYFRISGQINDQEVSGTGRIPFVYATSKWNYPWLKMTVGNRLKLIDTGAKARLYDGAGKLIADYGGGAFFQGLARPWMGLHTIDTIRRDAARDQIPFRTEYTPGRNTAQVTLDCEDTELIYTIDMQRDVVESISLGANGNRQGKLEFTYLQNLEETARDFASPRQESPPKWRRDRLGITWLAKLTDARW